MTESAISASGTQEPVRLKGWWKLDEASGTEAADSSGEGHPLRLTGAPSWTDGATFGGAVALDGASQWLTSDAPIVESDKSFSVAAWLRLDSSALGGELALQPGWFAVTAVSQDGPSHSPFYLGARLINQAAADEEPSFQLHWNMTAAPVDGSETGPVEWVHAHGQQPIAPSELDTWVFVVGVYDLEAGEVRIYIPGNKDAGTAALFENWPAWRAEGGLALGQARFRDEVADQWPGSVGQVRLYSGVLTETDAASLFTSDKISQS
ncbi:LamG-like jellyroll fold domain-containing protein [Streptomyces sp. NPDC058459]|uniref:LamG-like jellyroll fold domain-containing protein n=1 Tax=Streptomyces sp. NPDC058459 TaxID=3346508 RepID=UPI003655CAD6